MKICPTCQSTYPEDFSHCPRDGTPLATPTAETEAQLAAGLSRRFRIVRRLGQGGMGTVFLAQQIGVGNRPVALKVLNRKLLENPDFLLRFQNEAGSTGLIRHDNVVTIHDSGQADDGTPYIAMEFLEGESLRHLLHGRGSLPLPEVAEILQQTAQGLNAAHELGIIHRDLKPDNIFLTQSRKGKLKVKVVDFGIAKLRESAMHTQTGMILGTPAYMSAEQAYGMRSDELDARSDVYSLGVVVYEMVSGRVPFYSDTPAGYLRKHLMEAPPPFRAVAPSLSVPREVEAVVMKALTKNRDERYATALEFAADFAHAAFAASGAETGMLSPTVKVVDTPDRESAEREAQARERAEAERREKAEQERLAREKAEAERREQEKASAEQAAREKAEQERLAREKAEAERREQEKAAAGQAAREMAEQERLAREKAEAGRRDQERVAAERVAREKAAAERREREKAAAEQAAREKAERERLAREKAETERREKEKAAAEQAAREKVKVLLQEGAERRQRFDRLVNEGQRAFDAHTHEKAAALWKEALALSPDAPGLRDAVEMADKAAAEHAAREKAGQAAIKGRKATPSPAAPRGMMAWRHAVVAFLREPARWWINLALLGWLFISMGITCAWPDFRMQAIINGTIHTVIVGSALLSSFWQARHFGDRSTRPKPWALIVVCLLAILTGCNAAMVIAVYGRDAIIWHHFGGPWSSIFSSFSIDDHIYFSEFPNIFAFPCLLLIPVDLIGLVVAGLRIRCRRLEWSILLGILLLALLSFIIYLRPYHNIY